MPETPVNEDRQANIRKRKVRDSGKSAIMHHPARYTRPTRALRNFRSVDLFPFAVTDLIMRDRVSTDTVSKYSLPDYGNPGRIKSDTV